MTIEELVVKHQQDKFNMQVKGMYEKFKTDPIYRQRINKKCYNDLTEYELRLYIALYKRIKEDSCLYKIKRFLKLILKRR